MRQPAAVRLGAVLAIVAALPTLLLGTAAAAVAVDDAPRVVCRFDDQRLVEVSGITWSRRHPGFYWVHNDSGGGPYLYAIDGRTCRTVARVRVSGIGARDLEAIATGVDPAGRPVLWVGDIGDNRASWPSVRLIAVPEPARLIDQEVSATTYRFTYPDGGNDAESIIADPESARVWVVSKAIARGSVYRVPLSASRVTTAVPIADVGGLSTDAAMSPDGRRFVIRDYLRAQIYDAPVTAASLARPTRLDLPAQRQGESITFTADSSALLVASEGEREVWLVPLPASGGPTPSVPGSATASPAESPVAADPVAADPVASTSGARGWRLGLAALALLTAAAAGVVAARRFRA